MMTVLGWLAGRVRGDGCGLATCTQVQPPAAM
jgi:hypothetical protein